MLASIRKRCNVLRRSEGFLLSGTFSSRIDGEKDPLVGSPLLWPFCRTSSLYKSIYSVIEWCHQRGICLHRYLNNWLVVVISVVLGVSLSRSAVLLTTEGECMHGD